MTVNLSTRSTLVQERQAIWIMSWWYNLPDQSRYFARTGLIKFCGAPQIRACLRFVVRYVSKIRKELKGTAFANNLQTLRSVGYI